MIKIYILTSLLFISVCVSTACTSFDSKKTEALKTEIENLNNEISITEKENEKYSGGLVKALINSRIETLKQSREMLRQKQDSWLYGISINYTVDGKPFILPDEVKKSLPDLEREINENKTKIAEQEAETNRYSGGLVQALSLSTTETMKQTQAMLEQRRLAITYELPQYLAFQNAPKQEVR